MTGKFVPSLYTDDKQMLRVDCHVATTTYSLFTLRRAHSRVERALLRENRLILARCQRSHLCTLGKHSAELGAVHVISTFCAISGPKFLCCLCYFRYIPRSLGLSKFRFIKKFATFVRVKNIGSVNSILSTPSVFYS